MARSWGGSVILLKDGGKVVSLRAVLVSWLQRN